MFQIPCPHCGPRSEVEFTYGGDATVTRPDPQSASSEQWLDHVYLRDNPRGPHDEIWHHTAGCRRHLKVRRDVVSHEIIATGAPDEDLGGGAS